VERKLRFEYREEIHILERIQRETRERLNDQSNSDDDAESAGVCSRSLWMIAGSIRAYYLLAFGTVGERFDFVLHPDQRNAAIANVLSQGSVRDDSACSRRFV